MWGCLAAGPPALARSDGQLWVCVQVGDAIDAEGRLHVGPPINSHVFVSPGRLLDFSRSFLRC